MEYKLIKDKKKEYAAELREIKQSIQLLRKMENEYIQIITAETRDCQRLGDTMVVWENQRDEKGTNTKRRNMILNDMSGKTQSGTRINLEIMGLYTRAL